jgi:hypothetical protein
MVIAGCFLARFTMRIRSKSRTVGFEKLAIWPEKDCM